MLDIKRIREDFEGVKSAVESRGKGDYDIDRTIELDDKRRKLLAEVETLKAKQNKESKKIPQMKKAGEDTNELMAELKELSAEISGLDDQVKEVKDELREVLLRIPNTPSPTTPVGKDETENVEQRRWKEPTKFDFEPKAHWDIGTDLDILSETIGLQNLCLVHILKHGGTQQDIHQFFNIINGRSMQHNAIAAFVVELAQKLKFMKH